MTSYNFTGTNTTGELCAGIVKASGVFPKNPCQHLADLEMINTKLEFQPVFYDPRTKQRKQIFCVRVDGASDEGPSHKEIQFLWTIHHLESASFTLVVSCRNSGASYLNRVKLQNGCLALGHSNLFIPSTLGGSYTDSSCRVDRDKYRHNMNLAMDVYINRVNGSSCGGTCISLFKGADSSEKQTMRPYLIQYLKGSEKQRRSLEVEQPVLYSYFEKVWSVRNRHMTEGLPAQYLFQLLCSNYQSPDCPHPICQKRQELEVPRWYTDGPLVSCLPLPVRDVSRPWGSQCSDCKGKCYGHYLNATDTLSSIGTCKSSMCEPPSIVLEKAFKLKGPSPSDSIIDELAKQTLLDPTEVKQWFSHLASVKENRKRGAQKASETRR